MPHLVLHRSLPGIGGFSFRQKVLERMGAKGTQNHGGEGEKAAG